MCAEPDEGKAAPVDCPRVHELYELERGEAGRPDAERLRAHGASCADCRRRSEVLRGLAASLERLAEATRHDLAPEAEQSLRRRARVHGLLGRPMRHPFLVRLGRRPALKIGLAAWSALAAAAVLAIGFHVWGPPAAQPTGALERLWTDALAGRTTEDLAALGPLVQAAVGEELARPAPAVPQVADLLLAAYVTRCPQEDRQVADVRFLVEGVRSRRREAEARAASGRWRPPLLGSVLFAAQAAPAPRETAPLAPVWALVLRGRFEQALAAMPADGGDPVLRAWCLRMAGQPAEAARALAEVQGGTQADLARALWADLALGADSVAEAVRQYETLAQQDDRYWFAAGYVYRYELGDSRGAGLRFARVRDPRLAAYVASEFESELAAARREPLPLVAETFDDYPLGAPADWALVRTSGGEFRIVDVPGGRALQLDQARLEGGELLTGSPFWGNYTLAFDFRVEEAAGDFVLGAAVYRRADHTGYVLELSPPRLRLVKQFAAAAGSAPGRARPERLLVAPLRAAVHLAEPPVAGPWYTMKVRVQRVEDGVAVAGKVWRRQDREPLTWQVVWTDAGQAGGPLPGGLAGLQVSGARLLVDNLVVTRNK